MWKDFLKLLCSLYMAVLTALLPLYHRGAYWMLGDAKYELFFHVSLLCLGTAAVVVLAGGVKGVVQGNGGRTVPLWASVSAVDGWMLCYAGCAILSALFSDYGRTAWIGYPEWHMGAVSQLMFVGIYFLFSRYYSGNPCTVYLWEAAFFAVLLAGAFHRLGWDLTGLMDGYGVGDWEYSHLISTIGNINWFCGYCSVALAMPVAGYLKGKSPVKQRLLYGVSVLGLVLLCIQGSDVGPVLAAGCLFVCLIRGRRDALLFGRALRLTAGLFLGLPCFGWMSALIGEKAVMSYPADGPSAAWFRWGGFWILGLAFLLLAAVVLRTGEHQSGVAAGIWLGTVSLGAAVLLGGGALYLFRLFGTQDWLTGRNALWKLALQGFARGDFRQKLLGVGPDCFGEYLYSRFAPSELPSVEGRWSGAVFANAHNQWLNHLVNTGLLGLCCSLGIYIASLRRYRRSLFGVLALVMYGLNSLVSFQQTLSTPLFFLTLGICEWSLRREREKMAQNTAGTIPMPLKTEKGGIE